MRHPLIPLCLGFAVSVAVLACGEDELPEEPVSCPCSCTAVDPVAHCVNTQDCTSTADCPTGTVCAPLAESMPGFPSTVGDDPLAACGSSSPGKRCQLPEGRVGRQTLIAGFEVPAFALFRLDTAGPAAFTWNPEEDTHIVHCALFACPPAISETVRDGRPFFQIDNYAQCVMAAKVYEPGEGVFDLGDPSLAFTPAAAEACGTTSPRVLHELLVGCWAYDKSEIIAATPLEAVSPAEVFNYGDQIDLDCSGGDSGRTCALPDDSLGICADAACRWPCVTREDCDDVIEPPDSAPQDYSCFKDGGYVGVCVPADQVATEESR